MGPALRSWPATPRRRSPRRRSSWFFAEGATGAFFDEYILLANPSSTPALVQVDYLLPDGTVIPRAYELAPESRRTVWVDVEHPWLSDTAVSARLHSLNGVPFVAERSMWWADGGWYEAHNSPGAVETGTRWLVSAGEVGGPQHFSTYVLLANTSAFAGQARVTVLLEGGGTLERTVALAPNSRFNVDVAALFPETADRRFGTLVESLGADPAELVVEWSIYGTPGTRPWELGVNALAMNLSSPLRTLIDRSIVRDGGTVSIETRRAVPETAAPTFSVTNSTPGVAAATIDAATGRLQLTPGSGTGTTTVTVTARVAGQPDVTDSFVVTVLPGRAIRFGAVDRARLAAVSRRLPTSTATAASSSRARGTSAVSWSSRICARSASARSSIASPPPTTARTGSPISTATGGSIS